MTGQSHCTAEVVPTDEKVPFCATPANLLQLARENTKRQKDKDKDKGCACKGGGIEYWTLCQHHSVVSN